MSMEKLLRQQTKINNLLDQYKITGKMSRVIAEEKIKGLFLSNYGYFSHIFSPRLEREIKREIQDRLGDRRLELAKELDLIMNEEVTSHD